MQLKDIALIFSGQNAPQKNEHYIGGKYNFIKVSDLDNIIKDDNEKRSTKVNEKGINENNLKIINSDSIIFAKSGLSCLINRVYVLKESAYIVNHLCSVKLINSNFKPLWLSYFLKYFNVTKLIKNKSYPSISLIDIKNIKIPNRDLDTQICQERTLKTLEKNIKAKKKLINSLELIIKSQFNTWS